MKWDDGLLGVFALVVLTSFVGLVVEEGLTAAWLDLGRFLLWMAALGVVVAGGRIVYLRRRGHTADDA